ncbi:MAG: hypothetical protein JXR40_12760 [Pontiellaceae bacterium]|nr:hypothetical protein [Pontiellaceae bacterium]
MSKIKRRISKYRFIGWSGVILLTIGAVFAAGGYGFFNLPVLLLTNGITFLLLLATYGNDFLRFIPDSIKSLIFENPAPSPTFAKIAKAGRRYVIGAGFTAILIGLIQILGNSHESAVTGDSIAIALLPLLYAVITSEFFFSSGSASIRINKSHNG